MIKAVIFDFDGTIANTLPLCIAAFRKAIEPLAGTYLSDEQIIATFGPSEEGTIQALIPEHYDEGLKAYIKYYKELHGICPSPFHGIKETIEWLKANNIIVALVTGKGRASCDISLSYYQMFDYFDMIETGSPTGQRKVEGIASVLNHFNLNPNEAIYVGDAPSDILSARKANVPIISAVWAGTANAAELKELQPDKLFSSVESFRFYLECSIG